ncbi:MAG TPA: protein-L-isoaspartate O-methyltransferase [Acetobacteraceae bacterium]|nr:protein-L-isoaspartate O-methyltransferase [Acetobacteraceae bacterium]
MDPIAFEDARRKMVDGQIRPNRVTDPRLLDAMRRLPRERFLPSAQAPLAYIDEDIPLGRGRVLMEPMVLARLVQMARPQPGERVLVVAAGTGYGAAVLAACGAEVTALEEDEALLAIARRVLPEFAPRVALVQGPLAAGWSSGAPWDVIMVEGAVREIPPAIEGQVRTESGRLVTVLRRPGVTGRAVLAEPSSIGLRAQPEFDCATPLLPPLEPTPAFTF